MSGFIVAVGLHAKAASTSLTLLCEVIGFDEKTAKLACDPEQPKNVWKFSKNFIEEKNLKAGSIVKLVLTTPEFESVIQANTKVSKK